MPMETDLDEREYSLYQQVRAIQREYRREKDRKRRKRLKDDLIHLYVRFGEFLKMETRPDPHMAKIYLHKALELAPFHPVAHYRLAHLYYQEGRYHQAAYHFLEALRSGEERGLTGTQKILSRLLLVNCGIDMSRQALSQLREEEGTLDYDEELVEKYREMVYVLDLHHLHRALYRIITPEGDRIVTEEAYFTALDERLPHEVCLEISHGRSGFDNELVIRFGEDQVRLDYKQFFLVAYILHRDEPLTTGEIASCYYHRFLRDNMGEAAARKALERLNRQIPFFGEIIETTTVGRQAGRKRKAGISYRIFCRASDVFPWENEDGEGDGGVRIS